MADPASYRPQTGEIPTNPGVYRFRDPHGRVIYVGKAKNLRSRLNSYFANPAGLLPKTYAMVHAASSVEWTVVGSELESLQLEYTWIKEFKPRFNVMFRDDKTYPYLAVTMGEKYPRVQVMRGERRKGTRYFGPYTAGAIRETMDTLLRVFPVRSCSAGRAEARRGQRPALPAGLHRQVLGALRRAGSPPEDHRALAEDFCAFMGGEAKPFINRLEKEMAAAVAELDYERAARLRDDIVGPAEGLRAQRRGAGRGHGRRRLRPARGRARGRRPGLPRPRRPDPRPARLGGGKGRGLHHPGPGRTPAPAGLRRGSRDRRAGCPGRCWCPRNPATPRNSPQWLSGLRGARVDIRVPQRGDKAALMSTVRENAEHALQAAQVPARRRPHHAVPGPAGTAGGPGPARARCCGSNASTSPTSRAPTWSASMVVVEDGLPKKSDYRKFSITGAAATDDTAAMHDVLTRRFRHYLQEQGRAGGRGRRWNRRRHRGRRWTPLPPRRQWPDTTTPAPRAKFAYPPNLVVVDGGKPQVNAAARALAELGIDDVYVVGPGQAARGGVAAGQRLPGDPAPRLRRACTCCSASATRPTASPSPSTGRSAARP